MLVEQDDELVDPDEAEAGPDAVTRACGQAALDARRTVRHDDARRGQLDAARGARADEDAVEAGEQVDDELVAARVDGGAVDERKKVADFSLAYFNVKDAFVARKGEVTTFPDDLAGKTIGGYEASAGVRAFMADNYPDIEFRGYQRFDQIAADMQAGRIVGALEAETPIREFLGKPEGADFEIVHSGFCITCSGAGAMFRKGDDELRERVNTALREIYADGTFDTIAARWFPEGMNLRADMLWDQ